MSRGDNEFGRYRIKPKEIRKNFQKVLTDGSKYGILFTVK